MQGSRTRPEITLAICTLNRRTDLVRTLEGIEKQVCSFPWEVLVVDNGSDDGSLEAARDFAAGCPFVTRVLQEPRRGVSFARNRALEEAHGDILVFVDDDMDCDAMLLEAHRRAFEHTSVCATGGRILPSLPDSTPRWLRDSIGEEVGGPTGRYDFGSDSRVITPKCGIAMPFSGNLGLRRKAALDEKGFRTDLGWTEDGRRIGSEDTELLMRLSRTGGTILYVPEAVVVHRVQAERVTKAYYRLWNIGYGRSSVLMRPRPGTLLCFLRIIEQVVRILRYTVFPASILFDSRAKRYRKRYQAVGRILELLRIDWEPR